jgi:hypothetical protein
MLICAHYFYGDTNLNPNPIHLFLHQGCAGYGAVLARRADATAKVVGPATIKATNTNKKSKKSGWHWEVAVLEKGTSLSRFADVVPFWFEA